MNPSLQTTLIRFRSRAWLLLCLAAGLIPCVADRASADPLPVAAITHEGPVDFEREILPVLSRNCLACHSASKPESELVLETPQTILKGGSQGPAVVAGKPEESLLLTVVTHREEPVMPPVGNTVSAKNLTPEELGLLQLWIFQGAQGTVTGHGKAIAWQPLPAGINPIYAVAISPDGRTVATGRANQIDVYNVPTRSFEAQLADAELAKVPEFATQRRAHFDMVESLAFSPDGEWLASGSFREVKFWKKPHEFGQKQLAAPAGEADVLAISADKSLVAVGHDNGDLQMYQAATGQPGAKLTGAQAAVSGAVFTDDGRFVIGASRDHSIRMWEVGTGKQIAAFKTPSPATSLALAGGNQQLIVGCDDGTTRVYALPAAADSIADPLPEGAVVRELAGSKTPVTLVLSANADGTQVVTAALDGSVRLWDLAAGNAIRTINHGAPVTSAAVRPDGKQLATGSSYGSAKLWNLENGALIADLNERPQILEQLENLKLAIALAQREAATANTDLGLAEKRAKDEQEGAYTSAVEVTKSEVELKNKTEALVQPTADKAKAEQELASRKMEFEQAEARVKELEGSLPPEADDATKSTHAEELKKATAAVADLKTKVDAAEKEATKANVAFGKASDEKVIATLAIEAARRTLKGAEEAAGQSKAAINQVRANLTARDQAVTEAQLALAAFEQQQRLESQFLADFRADMNAIDNQVRQLESQLSANPATAEQLAAINQPATAEQTEARAAVDAADAAWRTAREEHRQISEQAKALVATLNLKKANADKALTDATNRHKAAVTASEAAGKPIADLEKKLQSAMEDAGKMMATIELQNAAHRQQALQEEVARTEALLKSATELKTAMESQLADAQQKAKEQPEAANARMVETLAKLNAALDASRAADAAVAGNAAVLASARQLQQNTAAALLAKTRPVLSLTYSPDGQRLLVADADQVREYGAATGEPAKTNPVQNITWKKGVFLNNQTLLALGRDSALLNMNTLPAWELSRQLGNVQSPDLLVGQVTALCFSPDGSLLATGGGEPSRLGELKIWDVASGNLVRSIENAHSDMVLGVQFSPDGQYLASGGADRFMKVFEVASGALVKSFEGHSNHVLGVSWRSDGRLLATSGGDKTCKVWDFEKGETTKNITGFNRDVTALQYLGATDTFITSAGASPQVVIRNSDGGTGAQFPGAEDFIYCVRASRDGTVVVAGGQDSRLHVWNGQGAAIVQFPPPAAP